MYAFSMNDGDVVCPECRRVMVDLKNYDRTQDVAGLADNQYNVGPRGGAEVWLLVDLISSIFDFIVERFRKAKIRRLCRDIIPQFPATLVCPSCLFLLRRKDKNDHPYSSLRNEMR